MADLYPPYSPRQSYHPQHLMSGSSNNSSDENHDSPSKSPSDHQPPKSDAKPQATFLTKLYAYVVSLHASPALTAFKSLLERPENHHMIRWDPAGEHIIVERPEQLALHVLPSIYRQSRFASFSRQLNVNLLLSLSLFLSSLSKNTQLSRYLLPNIDLWLHAQS